MQIRLLPIALSGALALGLAGAAVAQDTPQQPQQENQGWGHGRHGHPMDPDSQLAHMTRQLDLTADQQAQIRPLLVAHQQQQQALFQDQSLSQDDRRAKARTMNAETHKKIEALLTDEQKQKFQAMQQRMHHGEGGDQPEAQPQP